MDVNQAILEEADLQENEEETDAGKYIVVVFFFFSLTLYALQVQICTISMFNERNLVPIVLDSNNRKKINTLIPRCLGL